MALDERISRFIGYLVSLVDSGDRAALAALKRSIAFSPGMFPRSFPYIEPWTSGLSSKAREAFYLAAGLFAHHKNHLKNRSFPAELAAFMKSDKGSASLELRFLALLDAGEDELPVLLRRLIFIMTDRPIDWEALLKDLVYWERHERRVQIQWAQAFYSVKED